jgi:hypothetical protein
VYSHYQYFHSGQHALVSVPIERGTRISFAPGRYIAVTNYPVHTDGGITGEQLSRYRRQGFVLAVSVSNIVASFQLNPYAVVVAVIASQEMGNARMPGTQVKRDELGNGARPLDQQMGGDLQVGNRLKVRMLVAIQLIGKKSLYTPCAKVAWR